MWEKCKSVGAVICGSFGLVASIATILGYLSITPDRAASLLGHAFLLAAPAITFACGALAGWGFTKQASDKKARELEAAHAAELAEADSSRTAELAEMSSAHAAELAAKDAELREAKSTHAAEVAKLNDAHAAEIDKLKAEHARELEEEDRRLCEQMATMNREVDALRAAHRSELRDKDAEIAALGAEPSEEERLAVLYCRIVPGFSRSKARAAMKAYRADGMTRLDASAEPEVAGSIQAGQKVFVREALVMFGTAIPQETYGITDEFRAWLSEPGNLSKLEERCG